MPFVRRHFTILAISMHRLMFTVDQTCTTDFSFTVFYSSLRAPVSLSTGPRIHDTPRPRISFWFDVSLDFLMPFVRGYFTILAIPCASMVTADQTCIIHRPLPSTSVFPNSGGLFATSRERRERFLTFAIFRDPLRLLGFGARALSWLDSSVRIFFYALLLPGPWGSILPTHSHSKFRAPRKVDLFFLVAVNPTVLYVFSYTSLSSLSVCGRRDSARSNAWYLVPLVHFGDLGDTAVTFFFLVIVGLYNQPRCLVGLVIESMWRCYRVPLRYRLVFTGLTGNMGEGVTIRSGCFVLTISSERASRLTRVLEYFIGNPVFCLSSEGYLTTRSLGCPCDSVVRLRFHSRIASLA